MKTKLKQSKRWECCHCLESKEKTSFFDEAMCSKQCRREFNANKILNKLKHNREICFTCFRIIREHEKPSEESDVNDCVTGYTHPTQHSRSGEISISTRTGREKLVGKGLICSCGNTHHKNDVKCIQERFSMTTTHYLIERIEELDEHIDEETMWDERINGSCVEKALEKAIIP